MRMLVNELYIICR